MLKKMSKLAVITLTLLLLNAGTGASIGLDKVLPPSVGLLETMASPPVDDPPVSANQPEPDQIDTSSYPEAIEKTAAMVWDQKAQSLATEYGLNILNVTWEDTGRYNNSSVGPNISDVTIQVQHQDLRYLYGG